MRKLLVLLSVVVVGETFASMVGPRYGEVKLTGHFGDRMDRMIANQVAATDAHELADFFAKRASDWWWRTEFWGKYMHAACPFAVIAQDRALEAKIDESVGHLLAQQDADGYLGDQVERNRGGQNWDLWGMKYTLMGLLHYYDLKAVGQDDEASARREQALEGAKRLCDWMIAKFTPEKPLRSASVYGGLPSCSVLEPVVWLYRRSGERKYLDFAARIVAEMTVSEDGPDLLRQARVPVADRRYRVVPKWHTFPERKEFALTKAYEQMSCYQGLLEYWEVQTGGERGKNAELDQLLEAAIATAESIRRDEINLVGSGAAGEHWYHGRERQTKLYSAMQETCVVTTWMRLCEKLLSITGEPKWAGEIERSFHNAYLASLGPEDSFFAMYTPLTGYRSRGSHHCCIHHNCCNANGPRGYLAYLNSFAHTDGNVFYLNQFASGSVKLKHQSFGGEIGFDCHTTYPRGNELQLWYRGREPKRFTLAIRIPEFSKHTKFNIWGWPLEVKAKPGEYALITREWKGDERLTVVFDLPIEMHQLDGNVAFTRGPVVLARDSRFRDGDVDEGIRVGAVESGRLASAAVVRVEDPREMFLSVAMLLPMGGHYEDSDNGLPSVVRFTDFASAGNRWTSDNRYRVWLPAILPGREY